MTFLPTAEVTTTVRHVMRGRSGPLQLTLAGGTELAVVRHVAPSIPVLDVVGAEVPAFVGLTPDDPGRFVMHFQPCVALATGRVVGAEALLRWEHDRLGIAAPSGWLHRVEATGEMDRLGHWTVRTAIECLGFLQAVAEDPTLQMGVNVSPLHLLDANVVGLVERTCLAEGVAPRTVTIELTETSLIADVDAIRTQIVALRDLGCRIALDDFGVGYSSLQHLHRLPVDVVKLDRSYVTGLGLDKAGTIIVQAVLRMARALGADAIAEGVETDELRDALADLGCEYAQGFLYDAGLSLDAIVSVLGAQPAYGPLAACG